MRVDEVAALQLDQFSSVVQGLIQYRHTLVKSLVMATKKISEMPYIEIIRIDVCLAKILNAKTALYLAQFASSKYSVSFLRTQLWHIQS